MLQQGVRVLPHQPAAEEHPGEGGEEDLPVCRRVLRREQAVPAGIRPGRTQFNILFRYPLVSSIKSSEYVEKYANFQKNWKNFHNDGALRGAHRGQLMSVLFDLVDIFEIYLLKILIITIATEEHGSWGGGGLQVTGRRSLTLSARLRKTDTNGTGLLTEGLHHLLVHAALQAPLVLHHSGGGARLQVFAHKADLFIQTLQEMGPLALSCYRERLRVERRECFCSW